MVAQPDKPRPRPIPRPRSAPPCPGVLKSEDIRRFASALGRMGKGIPKTMSPAALAARRKGARASVIARKNRRKVGPDPGTGPPAESPRIG